ncbi:hypothetical protein NQ314_001812 [Rhamnusium bicolor]|uniref:Double jelly roll-like domain-containing protein n=1 Tax=Rhamnusium bicolor TaxID=1586634 RepID=A0AAV8ZUI5_9CUCU|nr:hypothetical protein NQ314_001812 [Rhamnusium bicolor]
MDVLNVTEKLFVDNTIVSSQIHTYEPYLPSKLGYNDEIVIPIQEVDKFTLPCESFLYIEGILTKSDGTLSDKLKFINNGIPFLFKEIRYQLNGITVDSVRDVGLTSTLKAYLSYNSNDSIRLQNAGRFPKMKAIDNILVDNKGSFNVCIPLKMLMGFFEDYKKILVNVKQELVLLRSSDDLNAVISTEATDVPKVEINKLSWNIPHISVGIPQELALTNLIDKNADIILGFRSWELVEFPELPETNRHNWPVKTTTKLETPRHVIIAFQTTRRNNVAKDMSKFDNCNLRNIKVFLNSERYPYNDLYLDFKKHKFASLYEMFAKFRQSYYELQNEPIFTPTEFKDIAPITYDCSHQKESIQSGPIVMRVEFETSENIPKNTSAYCLILHDKLISYNPLTKIVKQL